MSPQIAARYKYGDTLRGGMGLICPQTPDMEIYHRKYHIKDICAVVSDAISPDPLSTVLPFLNLVSTFSKLFI